jgi:hypothetical protein
MRSLQLEAALTELVQEAAELLSAALAAGAEVRFELEPQGAHGSSGVGGAPVLYAYRALTSEFIAERQPQLERLPGYANASAALEAFGGLELYLVSVGAETHGSSARAAIVALLQEVFESQSDFELHPERLQLALHRLERSALAEGSSTMLVATLHGLTISSPELALTTGLTIAQPHALDGLPDGALAATGAGEPGHLIVALDAGTGEPLQAIARGRAVLKDLLRALRLFGDGRVSLGALAWARVADGRWGALALGTGGRPYGMLVVSAEQEDELRAFCNLVSRRAPHGNEIAWALRRFEYGCERPRVLDALTDHLLALRALLEPEGPASGLLAGRLAALCATPERRLALTERTLAALALERAALAGTASEQAGSQELARELSDHLRALLRDVICGHLDEDLVALADQLLLADAAATPGGEEQAPAGGEAHTSEGAVARESVEQMLGDAAKAQEILDVFI